MVKKKSPYQCRRLRFDPGIGKIPWSREWLLTAVFLHGQFHEQRSLAGYRAWDCKELDTTEGLTHSNIVTREKRSRF